MNLTEIDQRMDEIGKDPAFHGYWGGGDANHGQHWTMNRTDDETQARRFDLHEEYRDLCSLRRTLRHKTVERRR